MPNTTPLSQNSHLAISLEPPRLSSYALKASAHIIADKKENPLVFGTELIINSIYRHIIIDGEPLELTRTEFDLLFYMAKHPNQIFSRQQLYRQVWGDDLGINGENTVRSHIGNLYKKLADVGKNYIQNTRGVGYKFVPPAGKE